MPLERKFSAFLNDPGGPGDAPEVSGVGKSAGRFAIPGLPKGQELGGLQPGSVEFQASHLLVILTHAYDVWAGFFDREIEWVSGPVLAVDPRAGRDLNASYDRKTLRFFFATEAKTQRVLYTSESSDVAAHECGHAILDAHHPDYWSSIHPETSAFHEAFGDLTALFTTLQFPSVRERLLKETNEDLSRSSNVTRLAEQLGRALYLERGKDAAGATFLRDLVNTFRYRETWNLPATAPSIRLSSESHSFSRVYSGAVYQIFVELYNARRKADPKLSADDALCGARDDVGLMVATALMLAPPGDAVFRVMAMSMFKAEQQLFQGKYFGILKKIFSNRRILLVKDAEMFKPSSRHAPDKVSPIGRGMLSMAGTTAEQMPPAELQRALRLRGEEMVYARELGRIDDERVVQYRAERLIPLKGKRYGAANGALVPVQGGLTLNVDAEGAVAFSGFYRAGHGDVRAIRDHVEKLAERERIYEASPRDEADIEYLVTQRKPYYIEHDGKGNKILRRAYVTCARCGLD
ncbi:MAG: hypothetical protein IT331_08755 [Anaerolineae bacterium]|nr:hypothetical protein [Anaerolineae bacterium]